MSGGWWETHWATRSRQDQNSRDDSTTDDDRGGSLWRNDLPACQGGLSGASTEDEGGTCTEEQWHSKIPSTLSLHEGVELTPGKPGEAPRPNEHDFATCPGRANSAPAMLVSAP